MLLFDEDPAYEYLPKPNQDIHRLGNHIKYNEYSMRSDSVPKKDNCIVLGFGDSVINGGTLTDQSEVATSIIDRSLGNDARMLNVSAGSWGPDNCAAYLQKFGDFNAKLLVLVVSSHDAHDNMQFEKIVGEHPSYPNSQYPLAILEVIDRYLFPRIAAYLGKAAEDDLMINKDGDGFNTGFQYFKKYSTEHGIPLLVYLHAEIEEIKAGKYNPEGQEIISFCEKNEIPLISGLSAGESPDLYIDQIHFNSAGQKFLASALVDRVKGYVENCQ